MSKGTALIQEPPLAADPDDLWFEELLSSSEPEPEPEGGKESLAQRWIYADEVDALMTKLESVLTARGQSNTLPALRSALRSKVDWVQVEMRGEGNHRYGYLPPGSLVSAPEDPTPVDRSEGWDF